MSVQKAFKIMAKQIVAQYTGQGIATPWSENSSFGIDPEYDTERVIDYNKKVQPSMVEEFGIDKGNKPNGSRTITLEKPCRRCYGMNPQCEVCHGTGKIEREEVHSKTNPKFEGRLRRQHRFNPNTDYSKGNPGSWSHNRDVESDIIGGENVTGYPGGPH